MTDSAIRMIPIGLLLPHPDNPRKDLGDLTELTESIKANGVMQNLTVVPAPESDTNRTAPMNQIDAPHFRVVIGHRRLAAARKAGLKELPCAVMEMTPEEQIAVMLAENIHRSALTPYEEAMGFQQLQIDFGKSAREISRMSGVGETTVRSRLKLADMDGEKVRKGIRRGATLFDFSELDKVEDERAREKCLDAIGTRNFKNELKSALEEQTFKHNFERWTRLVRSFAAEIPEPEHQMISGEGSVYYTGEASARTRIDYSGVFHRWTKDSVVQVPEDAGTVNYYFTLNDREITLYREHILRNQAWLRRVYIRSARGISQVKRAKKAHKSKPPHLWDYDKKKIAVLQSSGWNKLEAEFSGFRFQLLPAPFLLPLSRFVLALLLIRFPRGQDMPNDGKQFSGNGNEGFFRSSAGAQSVEPVPKEEVFTSGGGPGALNHHAFDAWIAFCNPGGLFLSGAFVVPRTQSRPLAKMSGSGKHRQIRPQFRYENRAGPSLDCRNRFQQKQRGFITVCASHNPAFRFLNFLPAILHNLDQIGKKHPLMP